MQKKIIDDKYGFGTSKKDLTYKGAVRMLEGEEKTIYQWFYK